MILLGNKSINFTSTDMKNNYRICFSLIAASLMSACGGGGGSTSTPETNPPVVTNPPIVVPPVVAPPVVVQPTDENALQTTLNDTTYAIGSSTAIMYRTINEARKSYGVGLLNQNTKLDTAASNHAHYVSTRWGALDFTTVGHIEDVSKPGFTGINPADRMAFAGYFPATAGELLTTFISVDGIDSSPGVVGVQVFLSGPYHRFGMLDGSREIGIADAVARFPGEGGTNHTVVINSAVASGAKVQLPSLSWVGLWPTDGATDVLYSFAGETPDPIPANKGACAGYPVSVQVRNGLTLTTNTFTMTEGQSGDAISVQLSTAATDINPSQARLNTAYIIPYKPLKLATKYTVHFEGAAGGASINKTWSFTTGSQNTKLIYGCNPS